MESSWIDAIRYKRTPDGERYLAVFKREGGEAMLYKGVPSYLPGLLLAGLGGRSIGRAYNRLLRDAGYSYQRVTGEAVNSLREMMS